MKLEQAPRVTSSEAMVFTSCSSMIDGDYYGSRNQDRSSLNAEAMDIQEKRFQFVMLELGARNPNIYKTTGMPGLL